MARSPRTLGNKGLFLFILIFLVLTDLAILLDIPILRPALGFVCFTIIPGLLILHILKSNKLGLTERFVLSVGLSVAFLMFFGLLINYVYFGFGYATPLSTTSVVFSFSAFVIILAIIGYKRNKDFSFNLANFKLDTREKAFLILPALFPLLSILGMHLMNTTNNNVMLMVMLFLIPAFVILIAVLYHRVPQRTYPVMIFLIGVSITLMVALRSSHIIGNDAHNEYYLFQLVANSQHWQIFTRGILDACLSITLLPGIYHSLMNINSEYLFKILYALLFSAAPLVIYIISKKYIGNLYAFLASFFFMSQLGFFWAAPHGRNSIAALFFILTIMVLFNNGISGVAKRLLVITFAASCIVSHYATTYIFFFMLLLTWIGMEILSRLILSERKHVAPSGNLVARSNPLNLPQEGILARDSVNHPEDTAPNVPKLRLNKDITINFIMLFFVLLFFWYCQVAAPTFGFGVSYINRILINLNQMFILEVKGAEVAEAYGQTLAYSGIPAGLKFVFSWLGITFIAIGVLSTIIGYKRMVSIPGSVHDKINSLKSKIDAEYWMLSLVCCTILVISVVLPYALYGYGMSRAHFQMLTVLSMFFVIGGIMVAKFLKSQPYWFMLAILIPYFMCSSGTVDCIFGTPEVVTLSSEGPNYTYYYIYDQESYAARWLGDNISPKDRAVYTDRGGAVRLISQGGIAGYGGTIIRGSFFHLLQEDIKIDGYIYLTYHNVVNKEILLGSNLHSIAEYQDKFAQKDKIYSNGGSEIYR